MNCGDEKHTRTHTEGERERDKERDVPWNTYRELSAWTVRKQTDGIMTQHGARREAEERGLSRPVDYGAQSNGLLSGLAGRLVADRGFLPTSLLHPNPLLSCRALPPLSLFRADYGAHRYIHPLRGDVPYGVLHTM